ncbi:MAG: hypothetical protein IPQ09_27820 [Myxococcales bacterium]|nr:hypothetical protein [Myxococcales bacterium]
MHASTSALWLAKLSCAPASACASSLTAAEVVDDVVAPPHAMSEATGATARRNPKPRMNWD